MGGGAVSVGWRAYLPGAVAAQPLQVGSVGEGAGRAAAPQGDPRVDEGGRSAVVVHKERLQWKETTEASSISVDVKHGRPALVRAKMLF